MIIKVQVSLNTNMKKQQMLIYDETKKHMFQSDATEEIIEILKGKPKNFFQARLIPDPDNPTKKKFEITGDAPWQKW
jgi:hypothetical protein